VTSDPFTPFISMSREKRNFTRIQLSVPTTLLLAQIDTYHIGSIANLSLGGCYFPLDSVLTEGEKCRVTITAGVGLETREITISGQVARTDNQGAGIEFVDNDSEVLQKLEKILESYSQE
jgi:hypothetical protein